MKRGLLKSIVILVLLFVFACQKQQLIPNSLETNSSNELPVINSGFLFDNSPKTEALDKLARLIAFSMQDKDFREFIKKQALKQIDGDYDVIYKYYKNKAVKGKLTLEDYLNEKATEFFGKKTDVNELISKIEDFQISVPVHCEEWDIKNYVPMVTYIPESFDEKTFTFVKAYDAQGNVYTLGLDQAPDFPVVVLGSCERTNYINDKYVDPDPGNDGGSGGGSNGGGLPYLNPNPRISGHKEYIFDIKLENLSVVESWVLSKPELKYLIYTHKYGWIASDFVPKDLIPSREYLENNFVRINIPIFKWYWDIYGELYTVNWIEVDDFGSTLTFKVTYSIEIEGITFSKSYSFTYKSGDAVFGYKPVTIRDRSNEIYYLSYPGSNKSAKLYFRINYN